MGTADEVHGLLQRLEQYALDEGMSPASAPAEGARLVGLAREALVTGSVPARRTELFVRFAGVGVRDNRMPVARATELLERIQEAVTAIGSAEMKRAGVTRIRRAGKAIGRREAMTLLMTPDVMPGSLVFRLEAPDDADSIDAHQSKLTGTDHVDGVLDAAMGSLMNLIRAAEEDSSEDVGSLAEKMRPFGSIATSKLSQLAEQSQRADVEVDLGLWSRGGSRRREVLRARGARALRDAAERNKVRTSIEVFEGVLRTVSDGADKWRLELPSGDDLTLTVDEVDATAAGALLLKRVRATVEVRTTWILASGKERRDFQLVSVKPAP